MSWGIDDVNTIFDIATAICPFNGGIFGKNGNTPFTFQCIRVHDTLNFTCTIDRCELRIQLRNISECFPVCVTVKWIRIGCCRSFLAGIICIAFCDDGAPVYQQIAEYLKRQILTGAVQDGEPMPSRRELAAQTGINPNTAQKAYRLMTEEGYVVTDGNSGSYLRLTPALREKIDEELTRGLVEDFVARAKTNRLSYKKVIALVSELWDDEA